MERLSDFAADIINDLHENSDWYGDYSLIEAAINRLAAYEDTGLEPEEIEAVAGLASENCAKTAATIDRLLADEKIVKTRGDRVRAMPNEELARQFGAQCPKKVKRVCDKQCHLCWLEWLRQPEEEN